MVLHFFLKGCYKPQQRVCDSNVWGVLSLRIYYLTLYRKGVLTSDLRQVSLGALLTCAERGPRATLEKKNL